MRSAPRLLLLLLAATTATTACASRPPPPKPAPIGAGWRTHHQGYVASEVTSTTTRQGNYDVTTTRSNSKQSLYANDASPAEGPQLVRGATVTRARLALVPSGGAR